MKAFTDRQRRWLWAAGLYGAGLIACFLLAGLTRWVIAMLLA